MHDLKKPATHQIRQNLGDFWFSANINGQEGDDVGLEEQRKGRETEAHVCQSINQSVGQEHREEHELS